MIIDVENGLIEAKAEHDKYVKEAGGVRPNTQRIVNDMEASMLRALQVAVADKHKPVTFVLIDASTLGNERPDSVRRPVEDIDFYGKELGQHKVTISWRHVSMEAGE